MVSGGVPLPLVAPGQPGQSKSLLFKRNFNENRYFFPSRPLPASPGNQNRYFLKGILIKIDIFSIPAAPGQPGQSKSLLFERNFNKNRYLSPSRLLPGERRREKEGVRKRERGGGAGEEEARKRRDSPLYIYKLPINRQRGQMLILLKDSTFYSSYGKALARLPHVSCQAPGKLS